MQGFKSLTVFFHIKQRIENCVAQPSQHVLLLVILVFMNKAKQIQTHSLCEISMRFRWLHKSCAHTLWCRKAGIIIVKLVIFHLIPTWSSDAKRVNCVHTQQVNRKQSEGGRICEIYNLVLDFLVAFFSSLCSFPLFFFSLLFYLKETITRGCVTGKEVTSSKLPALPASPLPPAIKHVVALQM